MMATGAVIGLPAVTGASPILHVAPEWPGGALNGSEAARTARHEAHQNQGSSTDQGDDHTGGVAFDSFFDDLDVAIRPLTLPLDPLDSTILDSPFVPTFQ